jgi:hypothetical protein
MRARPRMADSNLPDMQAKKKPRAGTRGFFRTLGHRVRRDDGGSGFRTELTRTTQFNNLCSPAKLAGVAAAYPEMSALGQSRTKQAVPKRSALPLEADIWRRNKDLDLHEVDVLRVTPRAQVRDERPKDRCLKLVLEHLIHALLRLPGSPIFGGRSRRP